MTRDPLSSKSKPVQRGDFWFSVLVLLFVVEFFITIIALCYGIVMTPPRREGELVQIAFPWIGWAAAMLMAPALLLSLTRLVTGEHNARESRREATWAGLLPERALRAYRFIRDAPLFMLCLALLALGATLLTIDSALSLIRGIALILAPYVPYFIGGLTCFAVAIATLMAWFRYKNNQLLADYTFRREVLEKTGIVLVSKDGKALLPPDGRADGYALGRLDPADSHPLKALPAQIIVEDKEQSE